MAAVAETAATTAEAVVAAGAAAMVAAAVGRAGTSPPHLGKPFSRMAATPPLMVVTCMMGPLRGPGFVSTITAMFCQATRCKLPCLFQQGNGVAAGSN
jgi:hypothetical protein